MMEIMTLGGSVAEPGTGNQTILYNNTWVSTVSRDVTFNLYGAGAGAGGSTNTYPGGKGGNGELVSVIKTLKRGDVVSFSGGKGGTGGSSSSNGGKGETLALLINGVSQGSALGGEGGGGSRNSLAGGAGSNAGNGLGSPGGTGNRNSSGSNGTNGKVVVTWP